VDAEDIADVIRLDQRLVANDANAVDGEDDADVIRLD